MPSSVTLKDGTNSDFVTRANVYPDGTRAFYHASDQTTTTDDAVSMVGTTMSKFSDGFSGPTLAAGSATITSISDNWNVVRNTGSMTIQQTNGSLVITTGTAVAEVLLVGKVQASIPANLIAVMSMTARSTNQEIRIGYLEVDASGAFVANPNLANFPNNMAAILWDGTSTTTVKLETVSGGHPSTQQVSIGNQTSSTSTMEYALEARPEDVLYGQMTANSTSARSSSAGRISTMVPSPLRRYAPFIWVRNTNTATSNVITIQRIISMDIQELQAEIGGGRGTSVSSQGVPVTLVGGQSFNMTNAQASTSNNSLSQHRLVSSANSTNPTSVKTSAGKVMAGYVLNTTATIQYLKLYNKTSAPTVGTDVPVATIPLPPSVMVYFTDVFGIYGMYFSSGIAYAITNGLVDSDTGVLPAGATVLHISFV